MTLDELLNLKKEIDSGIEKQKETAILEIIQKMKMVNISIEELQTILKPAKGKLPMKYRNPLDASQMWAGKGKHPKWYDENIAKGYDAESMKIV